MRRLMLLFCLMIGACDNSAILISPEKDVSVKSLKEIHAKLAFTCAYEVIPDASQDADVMFKYARWLQKNNQLKQDKNVDKEIETLYRIAAENGHHKANINLQNGALRGQFLLVGHEYLRMSQSLIDANVASGYYFIGSFLKRGAMGLEKDELMSLRYFRKAADEGSALAQYLVAEKLASSDASPDISLNMYKCAAEQGHGRSALSLGVDLKITKKYSESLEVFQLGVAAGNPNSAVFLKHGFGGPTADNELYFLAQEKDAARAERYEKIWRILANYSYANPKVPEINDIVPLPPAELPEWDGKLKWLEERKANIPPEKPSEELIKRLADEKKLDPATGRPLPGSPVFSQAHLSAPHGYSGQLCPVSGYWQAELYPREENPNGGPLIRHIAEGERFPSELIDHYQFRQWPFKNKITRRMTHVVWRLA